MLEFIIHPGPGKTGSSSIQAALSQNAAALLERGILLPNEFRSHSGDYHALAESIKMATAGNAEEYVSLSERISRIAEEARAASATKVVVSSDYLANLTSQDAALLSTLLLANNFNAKIVLYKRNLYKLAISTFQQQIQNGRHLAEFHLHAPFTYFHMTKVYCDTFGIENVYLRDYRYDNDRSWSVVMDFFDFCFGMELPEGELEWVNKSLKTSALNLLNYLNYFFAYPTPAGHLRIAEALRWSVLNIPFEDDKKLSISKNEAAYLGEYFLQDKIMFDSFMAECSPYADAFFSAIPDDIIGESFNDTVCARPDMKTLEALFSTLGGYVGHPHLIAEVR